MYIALFIISLLTIAAGYLMYWTDSTIDQDGRLQQAVRISIIVPARDEENNLPILLKSIQNQSLQPAEIIVANDGSTDRTAEIASSFGARVLDVKKEADWKGKTFACWFGAQAAAGDWLLFMDADTWFADGDSLAKVAAAYEKQGAKGMLSVQPYQDIKKNYENFSVVFNILVMAGMNVFSVIGDKLNKPAGFGPFLLTAKASYFQIGGHQAAKAALIEGLTLGEKFQENGLPSQLYSGKQTIHFRMYPEGLSQLIKGWTKHFATGSKNTHVVVMSWISSWIAGGFIIPIFLVVALSQQNGLWSYVAGGCYVLYCLRFYILARRIGNFAIWSAVLFPVSFLFFIAVFTRSWLATNIFKAVEWKGQKIDL